MHTTEITLDLDAGGNSAAVAMTAASSAQGPVVVQPTGWPSGVPIPCLITTDNTCFIRKGTNPTAVNTGADIRILAGNTYRVQLLPGERVACISTAGGNFWFSPQA